MNCEVGIDEESLLSQEFVLFGSVFVSYYLFLMEFLHKVLHRGLRLSNRLRKDPKVQSHLVAQTSHKLALLLSTLFSIVCTVQVYQKSEAIWLGRTFFASFAIFNWLQTNFLWFKHDLIKFERIEIGSISWIIALILRCNLILILTDVYLVEIKCTQDGYFNFTFSNHLHIISSTIGIFCLFANFALLIREFQRLQMRHSNKRYAQHLEEMTNRNVLWTGFMVLFQCTGIALFFSQNIQLHFIASLMAVICLCVVFTYGNRQVILCPLFYTPNQNFLPQDRESIIGQMPTNKNSIVREQLRLQQFPDIERDIERLSICQGLDVIMYSNQTKNSICSERSEDHQGLEVQVKSAEGPVRKGLESIYENQNSQKKQSTSMVSDDMDLLEGDPVDTPVIPVLKNENKINHNDHKNTNASELVEMYCEKVEKELDDVCNTEEENGV